MICIKKYESPKQHTLCLAGPNTCQGNAGVIDSITRRSSKKIFLLFGDDPNKVLSYCLKPKEVLFRFRFYEISMYNFETKNSTQIEQNIDLI